MDRAAVRDTVLPKGGDPRDHDPIFVQKGSIIVIYFYALHRDQLIYGPDAEEFNPERWDSFEPGRYEYIPFGSGSRSCVGQHKALAEASYILVRLTRAFETIESRDSRPWTGQVKLTARNANGCKVGLIPA